MTTKTTHKKKRTLLWKEIGAHASSLGLALLVVFAIRSVLAEPFKIPSGSMLPTLWIGDHLFVNKLAYGLNLPFSEWIAGHPVYAIRWSDPDRGDIVVFKNPENESIFFIKRIIGLPGDTVEVRNRVIYINGEPATQTEVSSEEQADAFESLQDREFVDTSDRETYRESLPQKAEKDGKPRRVEHLVFFKDYSFASRNFGPVTVPEKSYFMMGDNRDESLDSRFWKTTHFVPEDNLRGKASFVWFHISLGLTAGQKFSFHPGRIGTSLK